MVYLGWLIRKTSHYKRYKLRFRSHNRNEKEPCYQLSYQISLISLQEYVLDFTDRVTKCTDMLQLILTIKQ